MCIKFYFKQTKSYKDDYLNDVLPVTLLYFLFFAYYFHFHFLNL